MSYLTVFPARAGMNRRSITTNSVVYGGVPRAGGDEPCVEFAKQWGYGVFPARAGMNRQAFRQLIAGSLVFPARAGMNR